MSERFDGRAKFPSDEDAEEEIAEICTQYASSVEAVRNFPCFARTVWLKRFLAHYQFFLKTADLPGDIIEIGVFRGLSLMSWVKFLEIHNMGDRQKQVFGFDNWTGFTQITEKDGRPDEKNQKVEGGFSGGGFKEELLANIAAFDSDRLCPQKPRVRLIDGNAEETIPKFVTENPGLRISLLHLDVDLYKPTKVALECLWPLVVNGGVVLFDEYGLRPWGGESTAVDEYFKGSKIVRRLPWCPNPGGYMVKTY